MGRKLLNKIESLEYSIEMTGSEKNTLLINDRYQPLKVEESEKEGRSKKTK